MTLKHSIHDCKHSSDDSKHWSTRLRQTLSLTTFTALVEKVITCALGEYDPGYAQNDGRTLSKMWSTVWNTSSIVNLEQEVIDLQARLQFDHVDMIHQFVDRQADTDTPKNRMSTTICYRLPFSFPTMKWIKRYHLIQSESLLPVPQKRWKSQ